MDLVRKKILSSIKFLKARDEGSISVLVFGLFAVVLLSSVVLTDISSVIVAQRSLVQATESAAQSAAHALDLNTYYQGKHSALSFLAGNSERTVPVNCEAAKVRASEAILNIASTSSSASKLANGKLPFGNHDGNFIKPNLDYVEKKLLRPELSNLRVSDFQCNGSEVLVTTSANAWLPISLSLFSFESVALSASAGTTSAKKRSTALFGIF